MCREKEKKVAWWDATPPPLAAINSATVVSLSLVAVDTVCAVEGRREGVKKE